jgi:hypothetical protein
LTRQRRKTRKEANLIRSLGTHLRGIPCCGAKVGNHPVIKTRRRRKRRKKFESFFNEITRKETKFEVKN